MDELLRPILLNLRPGGHLIVKTLIKRGRCFDRIHEYIIISTVRGFNIQEYLSFILIDIDFQEVLKFVKLLKNIITISILKGYDCNTIYTCGINRDDLLFITSIRRLCVDALGRVLKIKEEILKLRTAVILQRNFRKVCQLRSREIARKFMIEFECSPPGRFKCLPNGGKLRQEDEEEIKKDFETY